MELCNKCKRRTVVAGYGLTVHFRDLNSSLLVLAVLLVSAVSAVLRGSPRHLMAMDGYYGSSLSPEDASEEASETKLTFF